MKALPVVVPTLLAAIALTLVIRQGCAVAELERALSERPGPAAAAPPESAPAAAAASARVATAAAPAHDAEDPAIAELHARVVALEERLDALAARKRDEAVARAASADAAPPEEIVALEGRIEKLADELDEGVKPNRDAVAELIREERDARRERRQKMRAQAEREWLEEFAEDAALEDGQLTSMLELARDRRDGRRRLHEAVRSGEMSWAEARAEGEQLQVDLEARLGKVLDEQQLELFNRRFEEDGRRGRGRLMR